MDNNYTRQMVEKYGFRFTKSLGQNFLTDHGVVKDIVQGAGISDADHVVEIGPGVGTLTRELLKVARRVTVVELDEKLIPILQVELGDQPHLQIIHGDALKVDFGLLAEDGPLKIVANLPYYVTTPIITHLLNSRVPFDTMTVMIQKEVAERFHAVPGTKEYGAITLLIQYYCDSALVRNVPPSAFLPRPKVESTVIRLTRRPSPRALVSDEAQFFKIIRQNFNMRRKMLYNALKALGYGKETIEEAFGRLGLSLKVRGETLSVTEFAALTNALEGEFQP